MLLSEYLVTVTGKEAMAPGTALADRPASASQVLESRVSHHTPDTGFQIFIFNFSVEVILAGAGG